MAGAICDGVWDSRARKKVSTGIDDTWRNELVLTFALTDECNIIYPSPGRLREARDESGLYFNRWLVLRILQNI